MGESLEGRFHMDLTCDTPTDLADIKSSRRRRIRRKVLRDLTLPSLLSWQTLADYLTRLTNEVFLPMLGILNEIF